MVDDVVVDDDDAVVVEVDVVVGVDVDVEVVADDEPHALSAAERASTITGITMRGTAGSYSSATRKPRTVAIGVDLAGASTCTGSFHLLKWPVSQ